jgi:Protein of unknown function (DUF2384)
MLGSESMAVPWPESSETLREDILSFLPDGERWLKTPHSLLQGDTPEQRIASGDLKSVRELLDSIVYVGIT